MAKSRATFLELGSDLLPTFMTHLASIVHLGFASNPTEFHPLFTELLKSYRKAIAHKTVEAIVIGGLRLKPIEIASTKQIDQIVATVTEQRLPKQHIPRVERAVLDSDLKWEFPSAHRGLGFKRHGAVRVVDDTTYVRLEGMDGALLPAHGGEARFLKHGHSYVFEGHTLTNDAKETIVYAIERAEPIPV